MNPYERACKIWLQSCSCADQQAPWLCQECTATFGMHLLGLVVKDSLMAKEDSYYLQNGWALRKHSDDLYSFHNRTMGTDLTVDLVEEKATTVDCEGRQTHLWFDDLDMLAGFVRDKRKP